MAELSHEDFDNLWEINPKGSKEAAYYITRNFLNDGVRDEQERVIDFDILYTKYKEYVSYLEPYQNGKYTKASHEIVSIDDYIGQQLYMRSYRAPKKSRDNYLFGDFPIDYIKARIKTFKAKFQRE